MIRRWANQLLHWASDYDRPQRQTVSLANYNDDIDLPSPIRFKIQSAVGGNIVEVSHYDRKLDHNCVNLYIIPSDCPDLGQAIGQILTTELLKA